MMVLFLCITRWLRNWIYSKLHRCEGCQQETDQKQYCDLCLEERNIP
jgi:hypothetical protein